MTSTASFKDKLKQAFSFFRWELKSCSGTLVVYSILTGVFLVIILTLCLVLGTSLEKITGVSEIPSSVNIEEGAITAFQYLSSYMIYGMTVIFTIIYTIKVFGYLHNKRQADLYGSMPVSRITLFFSKSASALVFSLIPALVFMAIMTAISFILGKPLEGEVAMMYVKMIMGSFACISAYGLVAVCCGTTINSIIMFIAVCVAYPLSAWFVKGVIGGFFVGSYTGYLNDSFIMSALNPLDAYTGTNVIYWIIFTVVCLAATAFLVKNRRAERAQSSFAYYLPCHIVKVLVAFLAGMFLGVLFGSLNVLGNGFAGFVFGFVLASVPAFIIAHLIFYKGFSQLLRTSIPLGALIVVVIGAMAVCNFDVLGYNSFIPEADDVASAGFVDAEYCYYDRDHGISDVIDGAETDFEDKEYIDAIINIHKTALKDIEFTSNQKFCFVWFNMLEGSLNYTGSDWFGFSYKLKNGMTVTRVYSETIFYDIYNTDADDSDNIYYDDTYYDDYYTDDYYIDEPAEPSEIDKAIAKITSTKKYQLKYSCMMNADLKYLYSLFIEGAAGGTDTYADLYLSDYDTESNTDKKAQLAKDIINAYRKDFEADAQSTDTALFLVTNSYDYYSFQKDLQAKRPDAVCSLYINVDTTFINSNNEAANVSEFITNGFSGIDKYEYFVVPKSYTNTIKVLKDAGILNDDLEMNIDSKYVEYDSYSYY